MKAYINGTEYLIDEPSILIMCKNETLDSGKIRISNSNKLNLNPFDLVKLVDGRLPTTYMLVDTFIETMTCLTPKKYTYDIDLFSLTKALENIVLPNLKITKVPGTTRNIYQYLNLYLSRYNEEIRVGNSSSYAKTGRYILSQRVYDKFYYIECPEMQWNQPTLREVFNDLMMVADCIPVLRHDMLDTDNTTKYWVIDYLDLTEVKSDISQNTNINYISSSKSSEDYVSELKVDLKNVTNPENSELVSVTHNEYFAMTSEEDYITTDNTMMKTQYPIYKINSLKLACYYACKIGGESSLDGDDINVFMLFDLCNLKLDSGETINLVYEEKEWELLTENYDAGFDEPFVNWPAYKSTTIFYTRNSNIIGGFTKGSKKWLFSQNFLTQLYTKLFDNCKITALTGTNVDPTNHLRMKTLAPYTAFAETFYSIEYETLEGSIFTASKGDYPEHKRTVIDNQTNSYVDSYNVGFLEYQKANRLGNLQLQINARYENIAYEEQIIFVETDGEWFFDQIGDNQTILNGFISAESDYPENITQIPEMSPVRLDMYVYDNLGHSQVFTQYIEPTSITLSNGKLNIVLNFSINLVTSEWNIEGGTANAYVDGIDAQGIFNSIDRLITIGDYYEDSVVYQTEYQVYTNHIEINAVATKDYVLRNYFTGVKSKIRSWTIASGSEALIRHDLEKYYLEFSYSKHLERNIYYLYDWANYFMSAMTTYTKEPLKGACIRTNIGQHYYPTSSTKTYLLDLINRMIGNSLVFTFGFPDNIVISKYITGIGLTGIFSIPGLKTEYYRYADENGEFTDISYQFASKFKSIYNGNADAQGPYGMTSSPYTRPILNNSDIIDSNLTTTLKFSIDNIRKDSQEITYISTQFEFCSDTNDITIGKGFLAFQKAIRDEDINIVPSFKVGNSSDYDFRNPKIPDGDWLGHVGGITNTETTTFVLRLELYDPDEPITVGFDTSEEALDYCNDLLENKTLYIARGRVTPLLLALNNIPDENRTTVFYNGHYWPAVIINLNPLRDRNKSIYSSRESDFPSYSI